MLPGKGCPEGFENPSTGARVMIDLLFKHLGEGRRQGRKPIIFIEKLFKPSLARK